MVKRRKASGAQSDIKRAASLNRLPDLVIEGGVRPLGLYIYENGQFTQPYLALWVEAESELIRAMRVIGPSETADAGVSEALEALLESLIRPMPTALSMFPAPEPGLPAQVRVNDRASATAAGELLAPLGVSIEYSEDLTAFESAFQHVAAGMGATEDGPPEPFEWEIDRQLLAPLYKAADSYRRRAPWHHMGSDVPISLELGSHGPQPGTDTLYAVVLGNGGEVFGTALYYSLEAFERTLEEGEAHEERSLERDEQLDQLIERMRQAGAPVDEVPPEMLREMLSAMIDSPDDGPEEEFEGGDGGVPLDLMQDGLVLYFEAEEDSDPTYLEWLRERKVKFARTAVPSFHRLVERSGPVRPTEREVSAFTLALEALNQFFSAHRALFESVSADGYPLITDKRFSYVAHVGGREAGSEHAEQVAVKIALPAEGYGWFEPADVEE